MRSWRPPPSWATVGGVRTSARRASREGSGGGGGDFFFVGHPGGGGRESGVGVLSEPAPRGRCPVPDVLAPGTFLTPLVLRHVGGRRYRVEQDFTYITRAGRGLAVPAGFGPEGGAG